jgi:hypothetical protein
MVFAATGATGLVTGASPAMILFGMVGLLSGWDLDHFQACHRLPVQQLEQLITRHLNALGLVDIIAIVFAGIYFTVHLQITFVGIFILVLLSIWSLGKVPQVVRGYRSRE